MIAPIDGSDPPERPLTPASFDPRNRSIQAKSSRGYCAGHTPGHATAVMGVRQRQLWGCDSNRAKVINGGPTAMAMKGMRL